MYRELQTVANNVNQMLDLDHPVQKDLQQEQQTEASQKNKSSQQKETGQSL
jgi:hypothetical protein